MPASAANESNAVVSLDASSRSTSIGCGADFVSLAFVQFICYPRRCRVTGDGPIGEAWVLSDRDDHQSQVANGPLKGRTIGDLMEQFREPLMGKLAPRFRRFPLLLKFLDAREMLSVQVHPSDAHPDLIPAGETGKTEAWVVIEAGNKSRIYAGLKPGTTAGDLRHSLADGTIADHLVGIVPKPGDGVFIPAGTVHTLGGGVVVFRDPAEQRCDIPPLRLGSCRRKDRAATAAPGRSGARQH
jgi:hypothetical protein